MSAIQDILSISQSIIDHPFGTGIISALKEQKISYEIISSPALNIFWTRNSSPEEEESCSEIAKEALLMMDGAEFYSLIANNVFFTNIDKLLNDLPSKKIFFAILKTESTKKQQKQFKLEAEKALTKLQLLHSCSHAFLENAQDAGQFVFQVTKSISDIPMKKEKFLRDLQANCYIQGHNKKCVKVSKTGHGLKNLWKQQLMQFNLLGLQASESVLLTYASPSLLLKAYDDCTTDEEKAALLQDLPVRRAAGPLTTVRRMGIESSKRICTFFNSTTRDEVI